MAKPKKHYINYVTFVNKLTSMNDEELQATWDTHKTLLRMIEQVVRLRRNNARVISKAREWKEQERQQRANTGTVINNPMADK